MLRLGLSRSLRVSTLKGSCQNIRPATFVLRSSTLPISSIRFNSSSSSATTAAVEISDKLTSFDDSSAVSGIAEHVTNLHSDQLGYLQSIGLAQGWGPTSIIERLLEFTHVYTGLPWWGTIITAAVAIRIFIFPLYVKASANATKMSKIKPEMEAIMDEIKAGGQAEQMKAMEKRRKLMKKHDVSMLASVYPLVQIPFAYGFFQALRKMANANVEGFSDQGYAWFQNLIEVDPYLGLHAISCLAIMSIVRMGGETGQATMAKGMQKLMYVLPLASIVITKNFAACVMVYFAANSVLSLIQSLIFKSSFFRKALGMPPKLTIQQLQANNPKANQSVKEMIGKYIDDSKQKALKQTAETNRKLEITKKRKESVSSGFIKRH
ncbi:conserved hypothetical protein [Candida tropicalis MYA-3404]|uniref:Membrane insertase YidC/Oxa/ALB C-terminal domain-containing protein n=1 Tax=Candida tropicalis (strain ATCC MYA-3404 / T1) TaxID=294747 RepID=C5MFW7_CANTT|nr:conserved hypothetical protein [Candida tropicalis MYA-3404]EER31230.1 conserved hypothetical protein [Candida tropicalis MYA-3404]KAG4404795.1 hypothetical protein JTP64_005809 [Candida tropicalis]